MKTLLSILFICGFFSFQSILMAQTQVIAHRGFSGAAPENTLLAFQKAIESGAEYLELDVHQTADKQIVVCHDADLARTSSTGEKLKIASSTWEQLKGQKVGYPDKFGDTYLNEELPLLEEALLLAKGKIKVCIEIKVHGAEKEILDIVQKLGVENEVIIFSFYDDVIANIRKLDSKIPCLFLSVGGVNKTLKKALDLQANAIGLGPLSKLSAKDIEKCHKAGMEVWRWTVNEEADMERLFGLQIDGLITNHPDKALVLRGK
jgi:glycerophosphoryl diester phosphodiesterase